MTTERLVTRKDMTLYFAAAAAVAVAGALHLMMAPGNFRFNVGQGILFTVGGIAQVFWIMPMIRKWGKVWYSIGIAGNFAFFAIWLITRFPGNPITGRGELRINSTEMVIEGAQLAFMGLVAAILIFGKVAGPSRKEKPRPLQDEKRGKKGLMILAGIVAALVLVSWFVLPTLMPRRGPGSPSGFREGGESRPALPGNQQPSGLPQAPAPG